MLSCKLQKLKKDNDHLKTTIKTLEQNLKNNRIYYTIGPSNLIDGEFPSNYMEEEYDIRQLVLDSSYLQLDDKGLFIRLDSNEINTPIKEITDIFYTQLQIYLSNINRLDLLVMLKSQFILISGPIINNIMKLINRTVPSTVCNGLLIDNLTPVVRLSSNVKKIYSISSKFDYGVRKINMEYFKSVEKPSEELCDFISNNTVTFINNNNSNIPEAILLYKNNSRKCFKLFFQLNVSSDQFLEEVFKNRNFKRIVINNYKNKKPFFGIDEICPITVRCLVKDMISYILDYQDILDLSLLQNMLEEDDCIERTFTRENVKIVVNSSNKMVARLTLEFLERLIASKYNITDYPKEGFFKYVENEILDYILHIFSEDLCILEIDTIDNFCTNQKIISNLPPSIVNEYKKRKVLVPCKIVSNNNNRDGTNNNLDHRISSHNSNNNEHKTILKPFFNRETVDQDSLITHLVKGCLFLTQEDTVESYRYDYISIFPCEISSERIYINNLSKTFSSCFNVEYNNNKRYTKDIEKFIKISNNKEKEYSRKLLKMLNYICFQQCTS